MSDSKVTTRWLIRRDLADVVTLEEEKNHWFAWSEQNFIDILREKNVIGIAAELDGSIIGYIIYELYKDKIHICKLEGSLSAEEVLLAKVKGKLTQNRRRFITYDVPDTELKRHKLLKDQGFKAIEVKRMFFKLEEADSYYFLYKLNPKEAYTEKKEANSCSPAEEK